MELPQNSHFDNNTFESVYEGIHCFWGGTRDGDDNISIQHNVFEHVRHFALEQQGNPHGLDIGYNWVDNWVPDISQMGFSIATGGIDNDAPQGRWDTSLGVNVHDNVIGGNDLSSDHFAHDFYYSAIEAMGTDIQVSDNFISGKWSDAVMYTFTTPAWCFTENTMVGVRRGIVADRPTDKAVPPASQNNHDNQMLPAGAMATPAMPAIPPLGALDSNPLFSPPAPHHEGRGQPERPIAHAGHRAQLHNRRLSSETSGAPAGQHDINQISPRFA